MRLSKLFGTLAKHDSVTQRSSGDGHERAGGDVQQQDGQASGGTNRPSSTLKASQIEVEIEPGLKFRSNPSMLIEEKPGGKRQIFPLIKQPNGKWRYALHGGGRGSDVDSVVSERIEQAMFEFINKTIVT